MHQHMPDNTLHTPVNGAAIKRLRESMGWKQKDLERAADVSLSTVQRAERSDDSLKASTLKPVADALGVPLSAIYDVPAAPERVEMDAAPAWFLEAQADVHRKLDTILDILEHAR